MPLSLYAEDKIVCPVDNTTSVELVLAAKKKIISVPRLVRETRAHNQEGEKGVGWGNSTLSRHPINALKQGGWGGWMGGWVGGWVDEWE